MNHVKTITTFAVMLIIFCYGPAAAYFAGADPTEHVYAGVSRLLLYLTLAFGNAGATLGFVVFHRRRVKRTGKPTTNLFTAFAIYREISGFVLALALMLIALNRYFPVTPDIPDSLIYFMIALSAITVLLQGLAFLVELMRSGFLESEAYLWPWTAFVKSVREALKEGRRDEQKREKSAAPEIKTRNRD